MFLRSNRSNAGRRSRCSNVKVILGTSFGVLTLLSITMFQGAIASAPLADRLFPEPHGNDNSGERLYGPPNPIRHRRDDRLRKESCPDAVTDASKQGGVNIPRSPPPAKAVDSNRDCYPVHVKAKFLSWFINREWYDTTTSGIHEHYVKAYASLYLDRILTLRSTCIDLEATHWDPVYDTFLCHVLPHKFDTDTLPVWVHRASLDNDQDLPSRNPLGHRDTFHQINATKVRISPTMGPTISHVPKDQITAYASHYLHRVRENFLKVDLVGDAGPVLTATKYNPNRAAFWCAGMWLHHTLVQTGMNVGDVVTLINHPEIKERYGIEHKPHNRWEVLELRSGITASYQARICPCDRSDGYFWVENKYLAAVAPAKHTSQRSENVARYNPSEYNHSMSDAAIAGAQCGSCVIQ